MQAAQHDDDDDDDVERQEMGRGFASIEDIIDALIK